MGKRTPAPGDGDPRHGTTAGYIAGCRGDDCKRANRAYRDNQRRRGLPDVGDPRHGTVGGYTNYRCRCDRCVDAMRTWDSTRRSSTRKQDVRENNRRWHGENTERRNAQIRAYYGTPAGKAAASKASARRRASLLSATVEDTRLAGEYRKILFLDPCSYCGNPCQHIDHIRPLSHGGAEAWHNLTASCASCNTSKQAKPVLTFMLDRVLEVDVQRRGDAP